MKRIIFAIVICLVSLILLSASVSAVTWRTNRDDITIVTGNADIDVTFWRNGTTTNVSVNLTLPCNILNLSGTETNFTVVQTSSTDWNATFNLTVNGIGVNSSSIFNNTGALNRSTLTQIIAAGVTNTDEYLNFTFNCSVATNLVIINITGTNVNFTTTWLDSVLTIKERDVTTPTVGESSTISYFTVNNSINISNSTLWFSLTGVVLNATFPSSTIADSLTNFTITTLVANGSQQNYTQYQKRGPYVYSVEEEVSGNTHTVRIRLKSPEALRDVVDWDLVTSKTVYGGYFDTLNYNTLTVTLNGVSQDWEQGSIVLEDFTAQVSPANNKWVFTWTVVIPEEPAKGILEQIEDAITGSTAGVPNMLWVLIIVAIIIVLVVIYYIYFKEDTKAKKKK